MSLVIIAVIITSADVNECEINNGNCQQMCKNLYGRHSCSCREGFVLDSNKRTCSGKRFKHLDKEMSFRLHYSGLYNDVYIAPVLFIIGLCKPEIAVRLRDLKSRLEILLSLCSSVIGIILTARLMVAMILLLLKILMSVSWDKMIVITFVKTIQWVVTDAGVTKVTSCLVTIEHAKVTKKQSRQKMVHTSNRSQDTHWTDLSVAYFKIY